MPNFIKYVLLGIVGLCLGLGLGVVLGHSYCLWVYNHASEYDKEDGWWGLVDGGYTIIGGACGALAGLCAGLIGIWRWQRTHPRRSVEQLELLIDYEDKSWPPAPKTG